MSEKIVTIQRGRGAWQGPESKAPVMPTAMRTLPTVTTGNASDTPVMCNDAAQLAALAEVGIPTSGDLISREAVLSALNGFLSDPTGRSVFAAIRALPAQPAAPARKVKALVWTISAGGARCAGPYMVSERIDGNGWNASALFVKEDGPDVYENFSTSIADAVSLEEGMAACENAQACILSAFEVTE